MTEPNLRVLLVDDDEADRIVITRHLKESFCVIEASSGHQGEEYIKSFDPACVLLDYRLPDVDGLELLRQFVSDGLPVIMLTGEGNEAIAVDALKSGADDYFVKSRLNGTKLVRALLNAIEKSRLKEEIETRFNEFEELVAAVDVQFRQPLFEISRLAMFSNEYLANNEIDLAKNEIKQMQSTITGLVEFSGNLLEYAKTASGEIQFERIDLHDIIDEVIKDVTKVHFKTAKFEIGKMPVIDGNRTLLSRFFKTLILKPIQDLSRAETPVHFQLTSRLQRNRWVINIANDIPSTGGTSQLLNPATCLMKANGDFPGLAFATCAKIIKRHYGRVWFEKENDAGTTISFTLPVIDYQRTL